MKKIIFIFGLFLLSPSLASSAVLVELFTSQGCSSCPPADKFAGVLSKRNDVVVLSLPVTYWDRLGWKDSLAKPKWTARQRAYARAMGERRVYTPQVVVDGKFHAVGSSRSKIFRLIKQRKEENKNSPALQLKKQGDGVVFSLTSKKLKKPAIVWRVDFIKEKSVTVGGGENGGRTITYYHVGRNLTALQNWSGKQVSQKLSIKKGFDGIAIFVQEKNYGEVLASASVLLK